MTKLLKQMTFINEQLRQEDPCTEFPEEQPPELPHNESHEKCPGPMAEDIRLSLDRSSMGEVMKESLPMVKDIMINLILQCTISDEPDPFLREGL